MLAPNINPVIFTLGPLSVRWYGLMYVIGFILAGFLLHKLVKEGFLKIPKEKIDSLISWSLVSMFLGARFAYVFIYNWDYYSENIVEIFSVWKGGLSFHGGLAGLIIMKYLFAKKRGLHFFQISDCIAIVGTPGLGFGRLGNFINHELWGRVTEVPWGMIFRGGGSYPRHPSQLYESLFEGFTLFLILFLLRKRARYYGVVSSFFMIGYGTFRYFIEFFREADQQLGYYLWGTTTMGQILCFMMVVAGIILLFYTYKIKIPITFSRKR